MPPRRPSKRTSGPLAGESNPAAPLDAAAFLAEARKACAELGEDLLKRADGSAGVTAGLRARWSDEVAKNRTADGYDVWRRRFVGQVAAAWVLSLVFVRTLEDRGALARPRLAGPGVLDRQKQFFELAPYLTERDYLLTGFRELSRLPGARHLFDAKHNPVWMLAPSAPGARRLLDLFRAPDPEAPAFRFGQADTRFLGDLYQDLDDEVKSRYALLQTPRFVESFILDRTLEPAAETFGLDGTRLIDPTCGSGHFLLGAFERLFDKRLAAQPGLGEREAARLALDAVHGVDINPYAVAIARFRLTLAFMGKAGYDKIADLSELPMHLVVADSLLHAEVKGQRGFGDLSGQSVAAWKGEEYALEDDEGAKAILNKKYAAVVGNPPYITVKDAKLREEYRKAYAAASGKYSLAAPFVERFFQLAKSGGYVGMIAANSFMKREFGKALIERYLPTVDLEFVANTSGAYIPGHGTPTVLLFGRARRPDKTDVLAVLAKRGEPTTPDAPEAGLVWRSIVGHWDEVGFENDYISVARTARADFCKHPWSLGGGGATELKDILEERCQAKLQDRASSMGAMAVTGEDELFVSESESMFTRQGIAQADLRPFAEGEHIRDWSVAATVALYPYDSRGGYRSSHSARPYLWPFRVTLAGSVLRKARKKRWDEYGVVYKDKLAVPLSIAFAEVATHNHFVLDRGGKVFKQTAPVIKLPEAATENEHLALVAYLNSSTTCFWMKQVCHCKTNHTEERPETGEPETAYYAFSSTAISRLPLPREECHGLLAAFARDFERVVAEREASSPDAVARRLLEPAESPEMVVGAAEKNDDSGLEQMVALQEDLDWAVYGIMGLCSDEASRRLHLPHGLPIKCRLFLDQTPPESLSPEGILVWRARVADLEARPELRLIEHPLNKRRWIGIGRGSFALEAKTFRERCADAVWILLLKDIEDRFATGTTLLTPNDALAILQQNPRKSELLTWLAGEKSPLTELEAVMEAESVPFLAAYRYTDTGVEKRAAWERTWDLQRREDAGEKIGEIPVPEKYAREDFRDGRFFNLRGKLDVPKERFISYPGCESDDDNAPVYGWAGWNHLQQAQALASLYQRRKTEEGWQADRLIPMLAGLDELAPWVKQWHNDPSEEFGGLRLGDYFADFVASECRELGVTVEQVRAWRPEAKARRKEKPAAQPKPAKPAKPPKPAEVFAVRPRVDDTLGEALFVLSALAHAQDGRIARTTAARAFVLLFTPDTLVARAPRVAKTLAKAWLRHATERTLPPLLFASAERRLLETGMLRREADPSSGGLVLASTDKTWPQAELDSWYHAEAKLGLDIVAVMRDEDAAALGNALAPEDQSAILGRIA